MKMETFLTNYIIYIYVIVYESSNDRMMNVMLRDLYTFQLLIQSLHYIKILILYIDMRRLDLDLFSFRFSFRFIV